jgi:hypothetical protein
VLSVGDGERALRGRANAARARVLENVNTRRAGVLCFVTALVFYGIESIAWPLSQGRDGTTYLMYYADMWHAHPAYPALMLFRTPLAPLFYGPLLQLGGPLLAEGGMGVLFACSVLAFAMAALQFGPAAGLVTAVALLVYPGYGALFHQVSSDPIFAFTFAVWTLVTIRALRTPSVRGFVLAGGALLFMVLARPGSQVLALFAVAPLLLRGCWRKRLLCSAAFVATSAVLLASWAGYNDLRYGSFVVARAGWADVPFYRVFYMDKLVRTENGPASRELADAVERDLLTKAPYRKLGIRTPDQFFRIASDHMWSDVVVITDREWGWHSDYAVLRSVSVEAIEQNPHLYARDVALAVWDELHLPYRWTVSVAGAPTAVSGLSNPATGVQNSADPGGLYWWLASTPSGRPPAASRVARLTRAVDKLQRDIPQRSGSRELARALNDVSHVYPWTAIWAALALVGLIWRRPPGSLALVATGGLALVLIVETELGNPPASEYGLAVAPAFILCGAAALTAISRPRSRRSG